MSGFIFYIYYCSKFFVFIPIDFVGNKGSIFLKYNKVLNKKIFQKKSNTSQDILLPILLLYYI